MKSSRKTNPEVKAQFIEELKVVFHKAMKSAESVMPDKTRRNMAFTFIEVISQDKKISGLFNAIVSDGAFKAIPKDEAMDLAKKVATTIAHAIGEEPIILKKD